MHRLSAWAYTGEGCVFKRRSPPLTKARCAIMCYKLSLFIIHILAVHTVVSFQCVHGHGNNRRRKVAMFKMIVVEIINIVWWNESEMGFCTEPHRMINLKHSIVFPIKLFLTCAALYPAQMACTLAGHLQTFS